MPAVVPRKMLSFTPDGDAWVAALDCGHRRHIRHRPPLSSFPWIEQPEGRAAHVGQAIECGRCAQRLWPDDAEPYRTTKTFDEHSVPAGLLADHRTREGVWGKLEVLSGALVLCFVDPLDERVKVGAGESAAIPPELPHHVELSGPVEFRVVFCRCPLPTNE
jgi:tellurite methyltransferase